MICPTLLLSHLQHMDSSSWLKMAARTLANVLSFQAAGRERGKKRDLLLPFKDNSQELPVTFLTFLVRN